MSLHPATHRTEQGTDITPASQGTGKTFPGFRPILPVFTALITAWMFLFLYTRVLSSPPSVDQTPDSLPALEQRASTKEVITRRITAQRTSAWLPVDTSPPGQRSVFLDPRVPEPPPAPAVKLGVQEDGLYVLEFEDLAALPGWDATVDPRTFHLLRRGESIPIWVEGEEDGRFDPGDRIIFYGRKRGGSPMFTKYSDEEVYWLTWGGEPGPRVDTVQARPFQDASVVTTTQHTVRVERDVHWYTHHTLRFPTRQTWWWLRLQPRGEPVTQTVPLTLPALLPGSALTITYDVAPRTKTGIHRLRVGINGNPARSHQFAGHRYAVFTDTVPPGLISSPQVQVTVEVEPIPDLGTEDVYLNGFTVTYTRTLTAVQDTLVVTLSLPARVNVRLSGFTSSPVFVWEVTRAAVRLQGAKLPDGDALLLGLAPGEYRIVAATERALRHPTIRPYTPVELRNVSQGADLIIITTPQIWEAAEQLAAYRRGQGYRVQVVDVNTLYDEFGWGWYHPEAIRAFLAYAYAHWPKPAPRYVILMGDGHWNFKALNLKRYGPLPANIIPPYLAWVDPYQGEVPVDIAYGMVAGNDDVPDLVVGRISVSDVAQARAVVEKIVAYEQGDWLDLPSARRILFVADNPDGAGNFPALVERLAQAHSPAWAEVERIYLGPMSAQEARTALQDALNRGAWLVLFQGHGAVKRWTHESIFTAEDIPHLRNARVWPLVLTFNCLDGYFAYPRQDYEAIAELMLRREAAGSIAAWSPAGLGTPWMHTFLADVFLRELLAGDTNILGEIVHRARLRFYEDVGPNEVFFTQTLFGDPLLRIRYPARGSKLRLPLLQR